MDRFSCVVSGGTLHVWDGKYGIKYPSLPAMNSPPYSELIQDVSCLSSKAKLFFF